MLNTKSNKRWAYALLSLLFFTACNEEWKGEQYENYLSFVNSGLTKVYIKYGDIGGEVKYKFPIQVSGSTIQSHDIQVNITVDIDTIDGFNKETFRFREDLFYKPLPQKHYEFNESLLISADSLRGYVDVDFRFQGLDTYDNYLLALNIEPTSDLPPNNRKYYRKSLIHINLFNDYSGKYSVVENVQYQIENNWLDLALDNRTTWVYNENTVFFYAGVTNEDALDRKDYRIYAEFTPDEDNPTIGTIQMWCDNDELEFTSEPGTFMISEMPDDVKPYIIKRYVLMEIEYSYWDFTITGHPIRYRYNGPMIMERVLNTLMPEEDQIQWDED